MSFSQREICIWLTPLADAETAAGSIPCRPDPEVHAASLRTFFDVGADEIHVHQVGDDQPGMFAFYRDEVIPRL